MDITDQGVGMSAEEMAHANWRLDNPPVVDVAVSRRMGLFVVGRLAARHGIRVRLRPAASGWPYRTGLAARRGDHAQDPAASPGFGSFGTAKSEPGSLEAELAGLDHADWPDPDRANAEQEVSAARTPKFAPLLANEQDPPLGPRRMPERVCDLASRGRLPARCRCPDGSAGVRGGGPPDPGLRLPRSARIPMPPANRWRPPARRRRASAEACGHWPGACGELRAGWLGNGR